MRYRPVVCLFTLVVLASFLSSCHAYKTTGLQVNPATADLGAAGSTVQFQALEVSTDAGHPAKTRDVTNEVTWESSNTAAVTIASSGLATSVGPGTATISASTNGSFGVINADATVTSTGHDLMSLAIIPASQTLYAVGETAQFVAIGSFNSSPLTQDMTNQVTWQVVDVNLATINTSGLATAISCPPISGGVGSAGCTTTVNASAISSSGNIINASAPGDLVIDGNPNGGSNLPSLTVYKVGLGTGSVVSTPSGTGINCVSGSVNGAVCTANFVLNSTVTLMATPDAGSVFGGWSANCVPSAPTNPPSAASASCSLTMQNSETVGAIFNQQ